MRALYLGSTDPYIALYNKIAKILIKLNEIVTEQHWKHLQYREIFAWI